MTAREVSLMDDLYELVFWVVRTIVTVTIDALTSFGDLVNRLARIGFFVAVFLVIGFSNHAAAFVILAALLISINKK